MAYERDFIVGLLKNNVCDVKFTKVDGSPRTMKCTLREELIPPKEKNPVPAGTFEAIKSVRVFDLEKQEWRSFRVDSVNYIEIHHDSKPEDAPVVIHLPLSGAESI